jgi:hypothetical protein
VNSERQVFAFIDSIGDDFLWAIADIAVLPIDGSAFVPPRVGGIEGVDWVVPAGRDEAAVSVDVLYFQPVDCVDSLEQLARNAALNCRLLCCRRRSALVFEDVRDVKRISEELAWRLWVNGRDIRKFVPGNQRVGHSGGLELVVLRKGLLNVVRIKVVCFNVLVPHDMAFRDRLDECRVRKIVPMHRQRNLTLDCRAGDVRPLEGGLSQVSIFVEAILWMGDALPMVAMNIV